MTPTDPRPMLFFDGVCNLCNGAVQFIIRHDKKKRFLFAPLQSDAAAEVLRQFPGIVPDSVILFYQGRYFTRSSAALQVFRLLGGVWSVLYAGIVLPKFIRDGVYEFVSRNRYRWFGKKDACMIPTPELTGRFLK